VVILIKMILMLLNFVDVDLTLRITNKLENL
jgi:hypothetical protein